MKSGCKGIAVTGIAIIILFASLFRVGCMSVSLPEGEEKGRGQESTEPAELQSTLQQNIAYLRENAEILASMIHRLVNEERAKVRLGPLTWDRELASIALSHSVDMAQRNYFDHYSPEGKDFADRYKEHGYKDKTVVGDQVYVGGENLFLNNVVDSYVYDQESGEILEYRFNSLEELARSTVDGWMESPGHRENIMAPFTREGIGIEVSDEGKVYITENFS